MTGTPWLDIIGIGEDGIDGLAPAARQALAGADTIIGGERHDALGPAVTAKRLAWPHPFEALIDEIEARRGTRLVILATGDPLWYSIGARITRAVPAAEITFHPQLSAFQLAAARMGWSLADAETLTAHGRPPEQVIPYFWPGARLLILTAGTETPGRIARLLTDRGYGASQMTVLGALGGPKETRHEAPAEVWAAQDPAGHLPAFHTLAVHCAGLPARLEPRTPGLPDEVFAHDGTLTGQIPRAVALARLMPARGAVLWDIGTGAGSVAIEWMRAAPDAVALGVDPDAARLALARRNADALGAPRLELLEGHAPEVLETLPAPKGTRADLRAPDAIFIGGGLSEALFARCWSGLPPGGRLVAHAVTEEAEALLLALHARHGGDLARITVAHAEAAEGGTGWRPAPPVSQLALVKRRN